MYNKSSLGITAGDSENGYVAYYAKHVYTEEGGSWFTDTADGFRFFYDGTDGYLMGYYGEETAITLPDGFTAYDGTKVAEYAIYDYAFSRCTGLTSVTIGNSVTSIGEWAFAYCTGLTSITIPDSVTSIGSYAFYYCTGLTSVTIGNSATSIGIGPFAGCSGLMSVVVEEGNPVYHSDGNCLIETASKTLVVGCKTSVIPDDGSVTSMGYAFSYCTSLTSITIPDSVTSIGEYAFLFCTGLTSVTIGNGVTSIGYAAFGNCSGLTSVTFEGTVAEWNAIDKGMEWNYNCPFTEVVCSDGTVQV